MDQPDISIYKQAFEASIDAIICSDETGVVTLWNPAAEKIFGYSENEILGQPLSLLMPEELRSAHNAGMSNFIRTGKAVVLGKTIEVIGLRKNCTTFPLELAISATKKDGWRFTAILRDITQRRQIEEALHEASKKLEQWSFVDGLTGITNRRVFDLTLEREWMRAQRAHSHLAVIMIDIDFFKLYNDHYGHLQGDACLKEVAQILKCVVSRGTDLVARFGGEEFVLLLPDTDIQQAIQVAEKCRRAVIKQNILHEYSAVSGLNMISVSLGVASITPDVGGKPLSLVNAADQLLYKAKANGRNRVEYG
jgi:diguanylate cyclase (GGDEF)-like protein/PAS domain S-box-containing protein